MGKIKRVLRVTLATLFAITAIGQEEEVELEITRAVKVTFQSASDKSYQLLSTTNPDAEQFQAVGEPVQGNGGKITVFYESQDDQKVFFKVEETDHNGGANTVFKELGDFSNMDLVTLDEAFVTRFWDGILKHTDSLIFRSSDLRFHDLYINPRANWSVEKTIDFQESDLSLTLLVLDDRHGKLKMNFDNAKLFGTRLEVGRKPIQLSFVNCDLRSSTLMGNFKGTDLSYSDLSNSIFQSGVDFEEAIFVGANLSNCIFHKKSNGDSDVKYAGADLSNAILTGAIGFNPDQPGIIFNNTTMPDGTIRTD